ncbi:MAG: site-specific integrase [Campylobacterota bacterium]|nr:site-specific integrase [Campylobacterota bacterium]
MELREIIKSVKIIENRTIGLDYRVHKGVNLPKGKLDNRFRFSTGIAHSILAVKTLNKDGMKKAFEKAYEHYLSLMDTVESKEYILFEDIAYLALAEAEADRRNDDGTKDYLSILVNDVLPTFGKMSIKDIKVKIIKAWQLDMGQKGISQSRFNKYFYVLKRVLDYAVENEYIDSSPVLLVKRTSKLFKKSKSNNLEYFSKEEMRLILDDNCEDCSNREKEKHSFINTYMHVAFLTGMRVGEISSLKISSICFESNLITVSTSVRKGVVGVTKTDSVRTIPMVDELATALKKYIGDSKREYLFRNPRTGKIYCDTRSIVDTYYKPMLKRLGLPYRILYSARHTFSSISMESGVALSTISRCLGHQSTEITSRYYIKHSRSNKDLMKAQLESLSA